MRAIVRPIAPLVVSSAVYHARNFYPSCWGLDAPRTGASCFGVWEGKQMEGGRLVGVFALDLCYPFRYAELGSVYRMHAGPEPMLATVCRWLRDEYPGWGFHLSCYAPVMKAWRKHGFRVVDKQAFKESFAPASWDEAKHGRPDVYFMYKAPAK